MSSLCQIIQKIYGRNGWTKFYLSLVTVSLFRMSLVPPLSFHTNQDLKAVKTLVLLQI